MTDAVAHRGPDAAGYHLAPGIGLGHRRLSIIDLSTGDQPLANEDGTGLDRLQRRDLQLRRGPRASSIAHGHRFRTSSDTEVIVHGYEQWGERCVDRFRGMFAFAVWDSAARRLLLARDRLGVKPLYYAELPGRGIVFGSELKSLLEDPDVAARLAPGRDRRLPDAALHPGAGDDLRGHPQAASPATSSSPNGARSGRRATGTSSSPATATRLARRSTSSSSTRCSRSRWRSARSRTCRSARSSRAASTRARSRPTWSRRAARAARHDLGRLRPRALRRARARASASPSIWAASSTRAR